MDNKLTTNPHLEAATGLTPAQILTVIEAAARCGWILWRHVPEAAKSVKVALEMSEDARFGKEH